MKTFKIAIFAAILVSGSSATTVEQHKSGEGKNTKMVTVAAMNAQGNYAGIQCATQCCACASCCDCPCNGGAGAGAAGTSVE